MHRSHLSLATAILFLAACRDPEPPASDDITYWQHVAPIYFDKCVGCHRDGGIAPFRLDNPEDASAWAEAAAAAVAARTMPPYLVSADGSCGEFRDPAVLAQDQIDLIDAWAAGGAVEGDPRDDLVPREPPRLASGFDLQTPEFVPQSDGSPLAAFDEYRCFLLEPGLQHDRFITGYDVTPGNPEIVHHVLAMSVDLDAPADTGDGRTNRDVIAALDGESPDRDGWPCFSAAGEGVAVRQYPVTWAPGMGAVEFPADTGVRLREDEVVVVQIHYNLHDHGAHARHAESDSTRVRLRLADSVAREGTFVLLDGFIDTLFTGEPAALEPGQKDARFSWTIDVGPWLLADLGVDSAEVLGVFPHMHERGRTWRAELVDPDNTQCLGDVQRWNFAWQYYYFYATPPILSPTSSLRVSCEYDTRGDTDPITPGWGTQNEMCFAGLLVVP